jgi:histone acetyltransferase HTATIP
MLQEIYGVYNPTTGSISTNFALRRTMEKDRVMSDLLALFIAADKYNLEAIKLKTAEAIIDRLPFIDDPVSIIHLASSIYADDMPHTDRGLRKAIIVQLQARLPAIMEDEGAWDDYSRDRALVKALHAHQCELSEPASFSGVLTPPSTPTKKRKFDGWE